MKSYPFSSRPRHILSMFLLFLLFVQASSPVPVQAAQAGASNDAPAFPAAIDGCSMFPANNIWNTPVDDLPVHARSDQWVNTIGRTTGFHMDFGSGTWNGGPIGIPYNIVDGSVPKVSVNFDYDDESDAGPYPIPANPLIEYGSDHHILIVDGSTCTLYELFDASRSGGVWYAGSGAIWDLGSNALRPDTWTSADAAGLPILPGLLRYDEILSGEIDHAIRFTAANTNGYIWPARHLTSDDPSAPQIPPMGARFRLKSSFDISGYPAEMQVILTAMKTYGIILADNGSNWYVSGAPDSRWDNDMLHLLDDLTGDDFEAVDVTELMVNADSGATGFTISGNVGAPGATLSYEDGGARTAISKPNGDYSLRVTANWNGTVTPSHPCFAFTPVDRTYLDVVADISGDDYTTTPDGLCVSSIVRASNDQTNAASVDFTVTFTESVVGVDADDFTLTTTGLSSTAIANVSGSGDTYTVTVNTGTGNGTIRLDVVDDDSIINGSSEPLGGVGDGNGGFNTGEVYTIIKTAPKPSTPVLLTPTAGAVVNALQPVFDWKDTTPLAHHYQVQIATNNTFTSLVIDDSTDILSSTFALTSDLLPGKLYYWRVRAFNVINGASGWSTARAFKTPLAQPTLVSPIGGASLLTDRPAFDWNPVSGGTSYTLQVSSVVTFGSLLLNTTVTGTEYATPKDLPQNKLLYWRVAARTSAVLGPWSAVATFVSGNPPTVPVLASPSNGALVKDYTPLLNWNESAIPASTTFQYYQLQVDDENTFLTPIVDTNRGISDFTPDDASPLDSNTKFFWRVRTVNLVNGSEHVSGWSAVRTFRTVIAAPVSLSMIPNGGNGLRPSFDWADATGTGTINSYTIQISTSSTFSTLFLSSTTYSSAYSMLKDLPGAGTYYWRVKVNGPNGPSSWSQTSFTIP